jgi:hypothetical protein
MQNLAVPEGVDAAHRLRQVRAILLYGWLMATRQPASEPYESRDLELGSALQSWVGSHSAAGEVQLEGPLQAVGMDPTWLVRLRSPALEADVLLFYGPYVDVSAFRPRHPEHGAFVGGAADVTPEQIVSMLDDLAEMAGGGPVAGWLRPAAS